MEIEGPFTERPVPFRFGLWQINSTRVYLSRVDITKELVISAVEKIETALDNDNNLMSLMDEFRASMIQALLAYVFPDLFKSYLRKTIEQHDDIQDFHGLVRQIIGRNQSNFHIFNPRFEELLISALEEYRIGGIQVEETLSGYKVRLMKVRQTAVIRYWVNGRIVQVDKGINSSSTLVKLIQEIKQRLLNFETMTDLHDKYGVRTLQTLTGRLFPNLLKPYLEYHFDRRINQGNLDPGFKETLREVFGFKQADMEDERFSYVTWDAYTETIFALRSWNLEGINICSEGPTNQHSLCWTWRVAGVSLTLMTAEAYSPHDVLNLYKKIKERLQWNIPIKRKDFTTEIVLQFAAHIFPNLFESYLRHFTQKLIEEGVIIARDRIFKRALDRISSLFQKPADPLFEEIVDRVVGSEYSAQQEIYLKKNRKIDFEKDVWKLYYLKGTSTSFVTFDFSPIKPLVLRYEVKHYFEDSIDRCDEYRNVYTGLPSIVRGLKFLTGQFPEIQSMADIQQLHVGALLIHLENHAVTGMGKRVKRLTVPSQKNVITHCGLLTGFLMKNAARIKTLNPNQNYFSMVTYYNVGSMEKNTEVIPESVVFQLLKHINGLTITWQRMLLIMLNYGLRFKEVAYLEKDCLKPIPGESKYEQLRYIPWKVLESRRDRGLDDYHSIAIHKEIADEIIAQTEDTKDARLIWGLKEIFIDSFSYKATISSAGSFVSAVNNLIRKCDIKVEGSTGLWEFTSRQCRKTMAVDAITNGLTSSELADILGHMQEATTDKYYAEVRKMKLAEMNAEFYKKKFQAVITDEYLEKFTEKERKRLYVDFCYGCRERELGWCGKPFSEGPCSKRTGKVTCASCSKLCVGKKHLSKWIDMANSQNNLVKLLVKTYKNEGIEEAEFESYREYQAERHWLDLYEEIVRKIEAEFGGTFHNERIDNVDILAGGILDGENISSVNIDTLS